MDELVVRFSAAIDRCTQLVDAIGDDDWSKPTPCSDWDLRALANHLTSEQLWAPHLLAGETIDQVGDRYDGDVLGGDPGATWRAAAAASVEAFSQPGVVARTVHLSYGDETAREYLTQMLTDAAVHGWDMATAIGADHEIEPDTASYLLDHWRAREDMVRGSGIFGDAVAVPDDADDATKLLALLGRRRS